MKKVVLLCTLLLCGNLIGQNYSSLSINELQNLKKSAIEKSNFLEADAIKKEIDKRNDEQNQNSNLEALISDAVKKENYLQADSLKKVKETLIQINNLQKRLNDALTKEDYQTANSVKKEILSFQNPQNESSIENTSGNFNVDRTETIYYDEDWNGVNNFDECAFYRILKVNSKNEIVNPVMDYYKTGELEGSGYAGEINRNDDKFSTWIGLVEVYNENGAVTFSRDYSLQKKEMFREGEKVYYYNHKGFILAIKLNKNDTYGKYFQAFVSLSNYEGGEILFDPNKIEVIFEKGAEIIYGEVLEHEEYMKKVSNRQIWESALVAWGESASASNTGYSDAVGAEYNYTTREYKTSSAVGYNNAAQYNVNQSANNNIANYANNQYAIKSHLNKGYLKKNTIFQSEEIAGFFNIKYQKNLDKIYIKIPINGVTYSFDWKVE